MNALESWKLRHQLIRKFRIKGDFPLREDGSSIISPSISSTDECRTLYPFKTKPFVERSFWIFTNRESDEPLENTWHEIMTPPVLVCTLSNKIVWERWIDRIYLDLRIQLAMNMGDEAIRDHVSAGEASRLTLRTDVCLYQSFGLRPIVTGLLTSRSSTRENSQRILEVSGCFAHLLFSHLFCPRKQV